MRKEQLEALGITEGQIAEVFKLKGKDIEGLKKSNAVLTAKKEILEGQLSTANDSTFLFLLFTFLSLAYFFYHMLYYNNCFIKRIL